MTDKIIVGLDIGTTKICAIAGKLNEFGKLEIIGMGKTTSDGVVRGMVSNIDKTVNAINKAIKLAEEDAGLNIGVVNVGIAGQHIKSSQQFGSITRMSNEEEISQEDLNRLTNDMYRTVTEPGSEIIHVMPQFYTVDGEENISDPIGMAGVKIEGAFHMITAHTNAIKNIYKCVDRADLETDKLILEPLASSMSVLSDEEKEAGVVLVDIGGGTTDIAIFQENIIRHTAVLPFGGNIITQDIKQGCQLLHNQAEALKTKFGKAIANEASANEIVTIPGLRERAPREISVKNLAYIIEARIDEIIELVFAEVVRSGYENALAGGIVITGGGSMLQHLTQRFEYITGMHTRIGYPNEHLGKSKIEDIKSPIYSTALGLVLAGFKNLEMKKDENRISSESGSRVSLGVDKGMGIFKSIVDKTKGLLMDDFDDSKKGY